jgi:putative flippase GtrA|tara:strand:- start:148 stop:642 length:495 start_codon:yes stop_codon:yes gene_type:complete
MIRDNLKIWIRGSSVGVFVVCLDFLLMWYLSTTAVDLKFQLYISLTVSLFIGFFGHKLWTFQNYNTTRGKLIKQILGYLTWEVIFIFIVTNFVLVITNPIDEYIKKLKKEDIENNVILKHILILKDNNYELNVLANNAIKHVLIFFIYTFVSIPIYTKVFDYKI